MGHTNTCGIKCDEQRERTHEIFLHPPDASGFMAHTNKDTLDTGAWIFLGAAAAAAVQLRGE